METPKAVDEFLQNMLSTRHGFAQLLCGSSFELPIQYVIANLTDIDIMYIPTDIYALPVKVSPPHMFHGKSLVIRTEDTYPGFVRLYSTACKRLYHTHSNVPDLHDRHGPAWMRPTIRDSPGDLAPFICKLLCCSKSLGASFCRHLLEIQSDKILAIHCPCWPSEAGEWKTRERPSGWPPDEIVDKVVASGCYFVSKPHHSNPNDNTQWRFSFSQAEVILIHSWTDEQKYIYHVLRLIKSEIVEACGGSDETVLCTYFFKTLMFWECERKPKEFWNDENVEKSISELLSIMIEWLIDGCCPNYFIPKCNMMTASTDRVDFTKETQLLLIHTQLRISRIRAMWPKAYPQHTDPTPIAFPEKILLNLNLMLVRDNILNPLYPNMKSFLMKQLTEKNSLLWRKASDLYIGILCHLQFIKTRSPLRKCVVQQEALGHFMSSLKENDDRCLWRFVSTGESVYELINRISNVSDNKLESSRLLNDDICKKSCETHLKENYLDSPLNNPVQCKIRRQGQFLRCYSREISSEDKDTEDKVTISATIVDLNTAVKRILQNLCANAGGFVVIPTHFIGSAYLANFYYTALKNYSMASALCHTSKKFPKDTTTCMKTDLHLAARAFPVCITNQLSPIFDEHFQTVLGVVTLHRFIISPVQDNFEPLVRISPEQFVTYLKIQCKRLGGLDEPDICENFKRKHMFDLPHDTYEPLSDVFMTAVLYASRCQI